MPGPPKTIWRPIEEASAWAKSQGIKNRREWYALRTNRPEGFPGNLEGAYGAKFYEIGGWGGFLGTGAICPMNKKFKPLEEASQWAKENNVQSSTEWRALGEKRPKCFPGNPVQTYGQEAFNAIGGWGGFLGTNMPRPGTIDYRSFQECVKWIQTNKIPNKEVWDKIGTNKPHDIPYSLDRAYPQEFADIGGWGGVFGTHRIRHFSRIERLIRLVLDDIFEPFVQPHRKQKTKGNSGKSWNVDILYTSLNLIIEFDGVYFHKDKEEKDVLKTKDLKEHSQKWNVIRIREDGLNILDTTWNVMVPAAGKHENVIQIVLLHLLSLKKSNHVKITKSQADNIRDFIRNPNLSKHYDTLFEYLTVSHFIDHSTGTL